LVQGTAAAENLDVLLTWPAAKENKPKVEPAPIVTAGQLGQAQAGEPFALDTLTLPFANPHKSIFYVTGIGFLDRNRIAISTIYGDVWIVSGLNDKLDRLSWQRFASGMYQPFGLAVRQARSGRTGLGLFGRTKTSPRICVLERGQITELEDLDGDGQADVYRNYYNRWDETGAGHAYDTALKLAPDGSFYFFKGQ